MKLPTWDDTDDGHELDPLEQFIHDNEPGAPHDAAFRAQLSAALDYVLMPRTKASGAGAVPRATKKSQGGYMPAVRLGDPRVPNGTIGPDEVRALAQDPVLTEAERGSRVPAERLPGEEMYPQEMFDMGPLPPPGKNERRLATRASGPNGPVDMVTYLNPRGDVIAARMARLTGQIHFVDPKTGDVASMGTLPGEALMAAAADKTVKYDERSALATPFSDAQITENATRDTLSARAGQILNDPNLSI